MKCTAVVEFAQNVDSFYKNQGSADAPKCYSVLEESFFLTFLCLCVEHKLVGYPIISNAPV